MDRLSVKRGVALMLCRRFVNSRESCSRRELILQFRVQNILEEMNQQGLCTSPDNNVHYLPSVGSFGLLNEQDDARKIAKNGTVTVLKALKKMFEVDDRSEPFEFEDLVKHTVGIAGKSGERLVKLGSYFAKEFSVFRTLRTSTDGTEIAAFTIAEYALMIEDPEELWDERMRAALAVAGRSLGAVIDVPFQSHSKSIPRPKSEKNAAKKKNPWLPGAWHLERSLPEGGQGWTYVVRPSEGSSRDFFVIKRLKNASRIDRFRTEINALKKLSHPNILRIVEEGETEGKPFYIAEYCEGGDLSRADLSHFSLIQKLGLFQQACDAIAAAHREKVIHRDIKPSNILLRRDGSLVVGDFGLCLDLTSEGDRLSATSEAVGPRLYMAPELEDGRTADPRPAADVYSLGKLLYFMVAGRIFSREKHRETGFNLLKSKPEPPNPSLHFVYEIFDRSIVAEEHRYKDAPELCKAVDGVIKRIEQGANVLNLAIPQKCRYCGAGEYRPMQGGSRDANRLTLACWNCGNVQQFSPPFNGAKVWWMS